MKMRSTRSVGHDSKLVSVRIEPFLAGILVTHQSPLSIVLRCKIVEVPYMTTLLARQLGQLRDIKFKLLCQAATTFRGILAVQRETEVLT